MRTTKLLCLAAVLGIAACGPNVASIEVTPKAAELNKKGATATLVATPKNPEGTQVEGVTLTFASSDAAVAAVDAAGKVTAQKSGDAKITVSFEKVSAEVAVKVSIPASLPVTPALVRLDGLGTRARVSAKVLDDKGREVKAPIVWESAAPMVATVRDGEITAMGAGEGQVFAVAEGLRSPVKVTVVVPEVATVECEKTVELKVGAAPVKLKVVAKDAAGKEVPSARFTYAAADAKVAKVDETGSLAAVGKGKTKVTVTSTNGKSTTVEVKVSKK